DLPRLRLAVPRPKPQPQPAMVRHGGLRQPRQGTASLQTQEEGECIMRYRAPVVLALLLALSAGCQREAEDYISVDGKIVIFNIRLARAYYALTLNRKEATPDGAVVIAEFENPAGGEALVSRQKVFPNMKRIDLQSPDVECVVADRPYRISIRLEDQSGKILQTIDTTLSSTI